MMEVELDVFIDADLSEFSEFVGVVVGAAGVLVADGLPNGALLRGTLESPVPAVCKTAGSRVTTVTFSSTQHYRIVEWMLSFGYRARPVSPDWFVDIWKEEVQWLWESVQEN